MVTLSRSQVEDAIRACDVRPEAIRSLPLDPDGFCEDYILWYSDERRRAYLAAIVHGVVAVVELQPPSAPARSARAAMCNICLTVHPGSGVAMWTNRPRNRSDVVVGDLVCRDFECRDWISGERPSPSVMQLPETLDQEARQARMRKNLERFMVRLLVAAMPAAER